MKSTSHGFVVALSLFGLVLVTACGDDEVSGECRASVVNGAKVSGVCTATVDGALSGSSGEGGAGGTGGAGGSGGTGGGLIIAPVQFCAGQKDNTPCSLVAGFVGRCTSEACCWSCAADLPGGGACPYEREDGSIEKGACMTGKCGVGAAEPLETSICF